MKANFLASAIGTLLIIVGTFMPWVEIFGITANGWANGSGGPLFLIIVGVLALGLNLLSKKWSNIVSIVLSVILILVTFLIVSGFAERGQSAAIGVWLIIFGGVINIIGSIMGLTKKKEA